MAELTWSNLTRRELDRSKLDRSKLTRRRANVLLGELFYLNEEQNQALDGVIPMTQDIFDSIMKRREEVGSVLEDLWIDVFLKYPEFGMVNAEKVAAELGFSLDDFDAPESTGTTDSSVSTESTGSTGGSESSEPLSTVSTVTEVSTASSETEQAWLRFKRLIKEKYGEDL